MRLAAVLNDAIYSGYVQPCTTDEAWVELVAALVNMNVTNAVPLISMIVDIVALPSAGATAALTRKLLSFVNEGMHSLCARVYLCLAGDRILELYAVWQVWMECARARAIGIGVSLMHI